jgi:hypothetical protein
MKNEGRPLKRWHETISGHMAQLPAWMMMMKTFVPVRGQCYFIVIKTISS